MRTSFIVGMLLVLAAGPIWAAEDVDTRNSTVGGDIPELCQITISGDLSALMSLSQADGGAGETDYDQGYVESAADATILTLDANKEWSLGVNYSGAGWTSPNPYDKAESDLKIKITSKTTGTIRNSYGAYQSPTDTKTAILDHTAGVSNDVVNIQTRVLLDWTKDIPGTYSITLVYTMETGTP